MPLMITFSTIAICSYMLASIILSVSNNIAIFNFVDIAYYIVIDYLEVFTSAFWAFLIYHVYSSFKTFISSSNISFDKTFSSA